MKLNPAQQAVVDRCLLSSGFNCVLQMPTGAGKTWLAELAIEQAVLAGRRAVYLTPLRAQADELFARWRSRFDPAKVGVFTGSYGQPGRPYPVPLAQAQILVMTPERLDACTRAWRSHWNWIPEVDLVVVDELHLLGDANRGARLEGAMLRIQRLNPFLRILGLSATLGNRGELADWLGGVDFGSDWRPIPLSWTIDRFRKAQEKPALLLEHVARCVAGGGLSLVFVQSRRRAEELASLLAGAGLRASHHHAGLESAQRSSREAAFRERNLDVLVSTGTLEMGLNLPVRQVVLYDLQRFDGWEFAPLPVWSVWQRAGRAGRRGLDTQGEVVLLAPRWDGGAADYARGEFEPIRSALAAPRFLAEQIVTEVASGLCRTRRHLERALGASLAARQGSLPVNATLDEMVNAGMLVWKDSPRQGSTLRATRLGRAAARHMLAPATVLHLAAGLREADLEGWTFFDLLLLLASSAECAPLLPVDFEELDLLAARLTVEPSVVLTEGSDGLNRFSIQGRRALHVIKTALVARAWTRRGDLESVAEDFGCYPFEVRRLIESLGRLLQASTDLERGLQEQEDDPNDSEVRDEATLRERLDALGRMIQAGLDEEAVTLTLVPGIGPKLAARIAATGVSEIEDLACCEPEDLDAVRGISKLRASTFISAAEAIVKSHSAWTFREVTQGVSVACSRWPSEVDPYRLGRAIELRVARRVGDGWRVWGGTEPHLVNADEEAMACDCVDAAKGHRCKHVLAVQLDQKDPALLELAQRLSHCQATGTSIDLAALWLQRVRRSAA